MVVTLARLQLECIGRNVACVRHPLLGGLAQVVLARRRRRLSVRNTKKPRTKPSTL